jgi:hypothetical protein
MRGPLYVSLAATSIQFIAPTAVSQDAPTTTQAAGPLPAKSAQEIADDPLVKWMQRDGESKLRKSGEGNAQPVWQAQAPSVPCIDDKLSDQLPADGKPRCSGVPNPQPFTPPPSPCSATASCAPGVGSESGILTPERAQLLEPVLRSNKPLKDLLGEQHVKDEADRLQR